MHRIHEEFTYDPAATDVTTSVDEVLAARSRRVPGLRARPDRLPALARLAGPLRQRLSRHPPPNGEPTLVGADASHAWLSVRLPDGGWLDLDPTNDVVPCTGTSPSPGPRLRRRHPDARRGPGRRAHDSMSASMSSRLTNGHRLLRVRVRVRVRARASRPPAALTQLASTRLAPTHLASTQLASTQLAPTHRASITCPDAARVPLRAVSNATLDSAPLTARELLPARGLQQLQRQTTRRQNFVRASAVDRAARFFPHETKMGGRSRARCFEGAVLRGRGASRRRPGRRSQCAAAPSTPASAPASGSLLQPPVPGSHPAERRSRPSWSARGRRSRPDRGGRPSDDADVARAASRGGAHRSGDTRRRSSSETPRTSHIP